jgi:glycosyltransferase involved in cell wall biosynthesis
MRDMPDGARVVVITPVLRRPRNAAKVAASLVASDPEGACRMLFVCSPDDTDEIAACEATGCDVLVMDSPHERGDWARKINTAYERSSEPLLFLGADDLHYHPGWLEAAEAKMQGVAKVVGTNDLGNARVMAGLHATHMLVARDYVDGYGTIDCPGKVLHEGYWHEFVDDEMVATAMARGVWAHAIHSHVEHLHPLWGKAETDEIYDMQRRRMILGRAVFESRKHLWEGEKS